MASQAASAKQVGKVTITVLDQETAPSGEAEFNSLIKSFEARYPNVHVKRLTRDFNSLISNETLLLAGSNVPDAVETDEGYPTQGRLAKAGLLLQLNKYASAWGWNTRAAPAFLACCRVQPTGTGLGTGPLYGFPATSQIVGVYYNKKLLARLGLQPPADRAQFETALSKAKAAGMIPIMGSGGDHDLVWWAFYLAMAMNAPASQIRSALLDQPPGFDTPQMRAAANELASWAKNGYFEPGFGGVTSDQAAAAYARGKSLFYVEGSWDLGNYKSNPEIGFMAFPASAAGAPRASIDAAGQPWAIPTKSQHPLAAALWLDWISSPANQSVFIKAGDLPIGKVSATSEATGDQADALSVGAYLTDHNTALPFFWAIPQAQNYWQGEGAGILSGHVSGSQFIQGLQSGWKQDVAQYGGHT